MKNIVLVMLLLPLLGGCFIATTIHGEGRVTSPGTGHFDCAGGQQGDCVQEYSEAGSETFHAAAAPGHTFSSWANCPYASLDTCRLDWPGEGVGQSVPYPVHAFFVEDRPPTESAQYTYNALGQRVTKTVAGQTIVFQYDLQGRLLSEIDGATGLPLREYVYAAGEPVAVLATDASAATGEYFVHADHLGSPALVTDRNGKVVVDIEATPFGEAYIAYDELGLAGRFPGQYRDRETGLHYNYFRDYDPRSGTYTQADPIGIRGGLNTYAYAAGNPVNYSDPLGLLPQGYYKKVIHGQDYQPTDKTRREGARAGAELFDKLSYLFGAGVISRTVPSSPFAGFSFTFATLSEILTQSIPQPDGDNDNDGIPDIADPDDDNDGVPDGVDGDPYEWDGRWVDIEVWNPATCRWETWQYWEQF